MLKSADACYSNACDLLADATMLSASSSWPRAAAMAILAEEEFSKAFMLRICADQGRWDSNIYNALRKHSSKQGISQALREWLELVVPNALRIEEMNKHAFIQSQPSMFLTSNDLGPILDRARKTLAKSSRDFLKQDALYVGIDESASTTSTPRTTTQAVAEACIGEARKFRAGLDLMSRDERALDEWR